MDVYALDPLGVDVSSDVRTLVDDENLFPGGICLLGERSTVKAGADN